MNFSSDFKRGLVISCPHDGDMFPKELMRSVCIPQEEFMRYHSEMRDRRVLELMPDGLPNCVKLSFPVSRLLCDPERFTDGEEVMEKYGMGWFYTKAYDGTGVLPLPFCILSAKKLHGEYTRHLTSHTAEI